MDYEKRYRLQSMPQARLDGSGCLDHDIYADYRPEGGDAWLPVPGRHKTISIPASEVQTALSAPTNAEKVSAYKDALAANLNTSPVAIAGWDPASLEALLDANDLAAEAALAFAAFADDLGVGFPVRFGM